MTENELNPDNEIQDVVYSLAALPDLVPAERGVCFAARPTGLYCSQDGGRTWADAYASLELEAQLTTAAVISCASSSNEA